jgi:hypothetical protein
MDSKIPEADWKVFRELHAVALDRFCQKVLADVTRLAADSGQDNHERYVAIYRLMRERDKVMAGVFDDLSRSNALFQLMLIMRHGLLNEAELARFTRETREYAKSVSTMMQE